MRFPKQFITSGALADLDDLTGRDIRVLLALIVLADDNGIVTTSQENLVNLTGIQRRAVRGRLDALENKGLLTSETARGKLGNYALNMARLSANKLAHNQANSGVDDMARQRANLGQKMARQSANSLEAPPRVPNSPTGTNHQNEPFARNAITTLITDRHLPLTLDELTTHAYRLGTGDPWEGYLVIKATTTDAFGPDVKNPAAVLRYRLNHATPRRNIPKNDEWMYRGDPTKKRHGIPKNDEWMYPA